MDANEFMKNRHRREKIMVLYECSEFYYESIQDMAESLLKFKIVDNGDKWRLHLNGKQLSFCYTKDYTYDEVLLDFLSNYQKNLQWSNLHIYVRAGKKIPILRSEIEECL